MATLKQLKKLILSASFSGMQSASSAASSPEEVEGLVVGAGGLVETLTAAAIRPNGRLPMAVAVGLVLLVLTVALLGYTLMISSAADDDATEEEKTSSTVTVLAKEPEMKSLDEPSLASESDEAPKLRRSARLRAKAAQATKKDL